ncbi:MAG: hypothetical protein IT435_11695 [Phycisphaerales bacterium]|nr:hypothetical protein [Phycisphaerales bacterium]
MPPDLPLSRRHFTLSTLSLLAASRLTRAHQPTHPDGESFLQSQARKIIDSARIRAGQTLANHHNATPYDLHIPGGNMGYPAFWIRDAVMMLGARFITAEEIEGWIRLIAATLRGPDPWQVRPSVTVPAYTVPDHINFDGKPSFFPGSYETGEKQGGHPWGNAPPLDDNFYFILAVYEHWRLTSDLTLFRTTLRTAFSHEPLNDLCEKIFNTPRSDLDTGLITSGDIDTDNAKDWGFCDSIFKSGKLLFPSILKLHTAHKLAQLFTADNQPDKAAHYRQLAADLSAVITSTFLKPAAPPHDQDDAWLHSATGFGNQPDIWGSALAVHHDAIPHEDARRISRALTRAYRDRTAIRNGQVRHILTNDPTNNGGWEKSVSTLGEYQNGGYWGTPTGWVISAIHRTDPLAAADLAREYLAHLRSNMRDDGLTHAYEWHNPSTNRSANPLYVASIALPYIALKEAGLLDLLRH